MSILASILFSTIPANSEVKEAFKISGIALNITASPKNNFDSLRLFNYLTSPDVVCFLCPHFP